MAMPKKRMSHDRSGKRRAHQALKATTLATCSNCKTRVLGHRVCRNCGFYNGRQVIAKKAA